MTEKSLALRNQHIGRGNRIAAGTPAIFYIGSPEQLAQLERGAHVHEFKFVWISKQWPFVTEQVVIGARDFMQAVDAFYGRDSYPNYKDTQPIPSYGEIQLQNHGGWIIYGETHTVLIYQR